MYCTYMGEGQETLIHADAGVIVLPFSWLLSQIADTCHYITIHLWPNLGRERDRERPLWGRMTAPYRKAGNIHQSITFKHIS